MRKIGLIIPIAFFFHGAIFAQREPVNSQTIDSWKNVFRAGITTNGEYAFYTVVSGPVETLYFKDLKRNLTKCIQNASNPYLTHDNKNLLFQSGPDSIKIYSFRNQLFKSIKGSSLTRYGNRTSELFSWTVPDSDGHQDLVIWNPNLNSTRIYRHVIQNYYHEQSMSLVVVSMNPEKRYQIDWIRFQPDKSHCIWKDSFQPRKIVFNKPGTKIAFIAANPQGSGKSGIFVIDNNDKTIELPNTHKNLSTFSITDQVLGFDRNSDQIFFSVNRKTYDEKSEDMSTGVSLDVWNYLDTVIQSQQLKEVKRGQPLILAFMDLNSNKISIPILATDEMYHFDTYSGYCGLDSSVLVRKIIQRPNELQVYKPNADMSKSSIFLMNSRNGDRMPVLEEKYTTGAVVSPIGKYIVYYDSSNNHYYCYDVKLKRMKNITETLKVPVWDSNTETENKPLGVAAGIAGWLENDEAILIYDRYDIWQVDPLGIRSPICITNHHGRNNGLQFRLDEFVDEPNLRIFKRNQTVDVKVTDLNNYYEGFVRLKIATNPTLKHLNLFPKKFWETIRSGNYYLTKISTNSQPGNWFITTNRGSFTQLSFITPDEKWNWYTKELIYFKTLDGEDARGILFKPQDFNPKKKYPIIIQMYEKSSDHIYEYNAPQFSLGPINPEWFASRGYLVLQPDILYKYGNPGECVYNSVLGAVNELKHRTWIDSTRMGLSGGSQGGFAVNYLVTRSRLFRAAAAANGVVDMISAYNALRQSGFSRQYIYETSQSRMGATLWEKKDIYLQNSSILNADQVNTPVLILHNKEDEAVPWNQGLEWYLGLRRLGNPVWMLQYDGEGHVISRHNNVLDYTLRLEQFFDHYLKDAHPPKWMTQGIPAKMKGINLGLELDTSGAQP